MIPIWWWWWCCSWDNRWVVLLSSPSALSLHHQQHPHADPAAKHGAKRGEPDAAVPRGRQHHLAGQASAPGAVLQGWCAASQRLLQEKHRESFDSPRPGLWLREIQMHRDPEQQGENDARAWGVGERWEPAKEHGLGRWITNMCCGQKSDWMSHNTPDLPADPPPFSLVCLTFFQPGHAGSRHAPDTPGFSLPPCLCTGFPCGSAGKESACSAGDLGSIAGLGRSAGEGNGYPLQSSGLENSMGCIVHGVTKSERLSLHLPLHMLSALPRTPSSFPLLMNYLSLNTQLFSDTFPKQNWSPPGTWSL